MTGHDDTKRKVVHATICAPAAEQLRAFCMGHGVTVTAFLDGMGHVLADMEHDSLDKLIEKAPSVAAALIHARAIDAGRRNREPGASSAPFSSGAARVNGDGPPGQ